MTKSNPAPDAVRLVPVDMQIESILHDLVQEVAAAQRGAQAKRRSRQCCARGAAKNAILNALAAAPAPATARGGECPEHRRLSVKLIGTVENAGAFLCRAEKAEAIISAALDKDVEAEIEDSWTDLVEMSDRTSPPEYPDHCLISRAELAAYMGNAAFVARTNALASQPQATGGAVDLADLFARLDDILIEESSMHPFGCATWEEASRVAIDMAKDALTRLSANPTGGAVERIDHLFVAEQIMAKLHEDIPALDAYDEDELASFEAGIATTILAAIATQPAPSPGVEWDRTVNFGFRTDEPSLREMVAHYYRSHSMPDPLALAAKYISLHALPAAPSIQKGDEG